MAREQVSGRSVSSWPSTLKKTLSEEDVSELISEAILDQRLTPGTKLKEVHLAELFGVTRGMIRKVLSNLTHSKLVEREPNRAARVANPSVQDGRDLFAARRTIERGIIEILVEKITTVQVNQLKSILTKEREAYDANDTKLALSYSVEFHRALASMAGNSVLEAFLNDILTRTPLVILAHLGSQSDNTCANHEHSDIVDALARGDVKTAVIIMDEHLSHIEERLNQKEQQRNDDLSGIFFREQH